MKLSFDLFDTSDNIVCVRDGTEVIYQNDLSLRFCRVGNCLKCVDRCHALIEKNKGLMSAKSSFLFLRNQKIEGVSYDFLVFREFDKTVTILVPEENQLKKLTNFFQKKGLTVRESEVVALKFMGHSNKEIAARLFVSVSTVKTHINHVNQKLNIGQKLD